MKHNYTDPKIEISEVEGQGLFCASGSNEDFGNGPDYGKDIFDVIKPFKQPFCIAFLAALLLASCTIENPVPTDSKTYKVTTEQSDTRTYLRYDNTKDVYEVIWQGGDKVAITDGTDTAIYGADYGGFTSTTLSKVSGTDPTGALTAWFPESISSMTLPAVRPYNYQNTFNDSPMRGTVDGDNITFKNLCGIVKCAISTTASDVAIKSLSITADKGLSGPFTVENDAAVVSGTAGVTVMCDTPVSVGPAPTCFFRFAIPAGTYSKFEIKAVTSDGRTQTLKANQPIKIERSKLSEITLEFNNLVASTAGVAILPAGPDFCSAIKSLAVPEATYDMVDLEIKRIVFSTLDNTVYGPDIADLESPEPVYAGFQDGVVMIGTPGTEFVLPEDATYMFAMYQNLEAIDNIASLNTENVTSMQQMFGALSCDTTHLEVLDLSTFNTENVTSFRSMFNSQKSLKSLNVKGWDTNNVENMMYMFQYCYALEELDLSNWGNELCEDFSYMFNYAGLRSINLENFGTESAAKMEYMFGHCESLETLDVSSFNTENVTSFGNMFWHNYKLSMINGLKNFDTSAGSIFRSMFNRCDALIELDCSSFDVSYATNCKYMMYKCMSLQKLDVSGFDITGLQASVFEYMMPKLQSIREIHYGDSFIPADPTKVPNAFSMLYADTEEESMGCQNPTKTVTIYCSPEVADYLVTTDMHYPHNGWHYTAEGVDRTHQPITINFINWKTNTPINISWPANERYPL